MRVVFAASECVPYIKTGGLADVIGALPSEVARLGHDVTVYLPFYRQVQAKVKQRNVVIRSLTIPFEYYNRFVTILDGGKQDGVQFYFVDSPELFDREYVYATPTGDYADNWERFGLFCRAVLESCKQIGVPDVFHVHDWETAMLPVYLRTTYYFDPALRSAGGSDHSQSRTAGLVSAGDHAASITPVGRLHHGPPRTEQQFQFSKGRPCLL